MLTFKTFSNDSLWDRLPTEVQLRIFRRCDALTIFLNEDQHARIKLLLPRDQTLIWKEAFIQDWDGDLSLLPKNHVPTINHGLELVRSRKMYQRLCHVLKNLAEGPGTFSNSANNYKNSYDIRKHTQYLIEDERGRWLRRWLATSEARRLIHIPLRHM
jgi:hypothetical protein